ncbi:hypothetical protein PM10SUCC1_37580 [Propionigenium maris DSM 9537]|uniref:N-acetyltransferase domain-containing protein n=1 Tax=Propionigenium maris DSM 9537 TaxID=1123000 RepID=A0A9W6GQ76_9FUSO|nr:GNAT family N-acetyltransferase [Propionigenium maris]GLI58244.1 hypothetical protein PM10SUCC1_37580 [Propionigenium maris DSM 9537]
MLEVKTREFKNHLKDFIHFSDVIAIEAILRGGSKGQLYINNLKKPEALVIWNEFDGFYVSLSNDRFLKYVRDIIVDALKNNTRGSTEFVIYIDKKYDNQVAQIIPSDEYSKLKVLFYTTDNFLRSGQSLGNIPVKEIKYFTDINSYMGFEKLREVIESTWTSYEVFKVYGEGLVAINENNKQIIGYCISEHATKSSIEFSIEVEESYQRQGIGFELGQRMVKICKSIDKRPCWYCTGDNVASMKLAEKLGLELKSSFHVWYFDSGK